MTTKELTRIVVDALEDKKALDIQVIDISDVSIMADYFVIASGTNPNQVHAMANNVEEKLHEVHVNPRQVEGYQAGSWILMDFNDIIVHVFHQEARSFYNLEKIWLDGKKVDLSDL